MRQIICRSFNQNNYSNLNQTMRIIVRMIKNPLLSINDSSSKIVILHIISQTINQSSASNIGREEWRMHIGVFYGPCSMTRFPHNCILFLDFIVFDLVFSDWVSIVEWCQFGFSTGFTIGSCGLIQGFIGVFLFEAHCLS